MNNFELEERTPESRARYWERMWQDEKLAGAKLEKQLAEAQEERKKDVREGCLGLAEINVTLIADLNEACRYARKYYRLHREGEVRLKEWDEYGQAELKEAQKRVVELSEDIQQAHKAVSEHAGYAPASLVQRIRQQLKSK